MLPVVILVVVAIPLVVFAFLTVRRGERPSAETTEADRVRNEEEFEEAEQYQAQWREQNHEHLRDERLP